MARDIYIAIMVAAANGRGINLSPEEVFDLTRDDAIATRANNALTAKEHETDAMGWEFWKRINPRTPREASNWMVG